MKEVNSIIKKSKLSLNQQKQMLNKLEHSIVKEQKLIMKKLNKIY